MIVRKNLKRSTQRGMVLITTLLLLIVVTILAVGMFRSFGLDEKIAGNTREKQRALNAAETAEQYAEYWLANGTGNSTIVCTGPATASPSSANPIGQVCSNTLPTVVPNVAQVPWQIGGVNVGVTYTPSTPTAMNVVGNAGGAGNYYAAPVYYISFLGISTNGLQTYYQIDAVGYGGSPDTAAVVESTYVLQQSTKCLSCSQ
jgi:type IV pilus assembly protein PilX